LLRDEFLVLQILHNFTGIALNYVSTPIESDYSKEDGWLKWGGAYLTEESKNHVVSTEVESYYPLQGRSVT
jgi:hypothetical protein